MFDPLDGQVVVGDLPPGAPKGTPLQTPQTIMINGPVLPGPDMYAVEILIDGLEQALATGREIPEVLRSVEAIEEELNRMSDADIVAELQILAAAGSTR